MADERHPDHRTALGPDGGDSTVKPTRRIIHHSIAHQVLNADNVESVNTGTASGGSGIARSLSLIDLVNRRPQIMNGRSAGHDLFREGTGKLIMPAKNLRDQYIHAVGEEITGGSRSLCGSIKGQEPNKRSYLIAFSGIDRSRCSTSRRTRSRTPKGSRC